MEFVEYLVSSFNPQEVFSSLSNFVGSGYVFIAIAALVVYGLVKKLVKLALFAGIAFLVWLLFTTGSVDGAINALEQYLPFLK